VRLVFLGPPGAGKGSLASLFHKRLGVPHLSTGQIFRDEIARNSALGRRVKTFVTQGLLVPNTLVVEVMAKRLSDRRAASRGFILDGFPRTRGQASGLDHVLRRHGQSLDGAIYLTSPMPLLVRRLSGRRVCERCGENYHIRTMRPQLPGRCNRCHGKLIIRKDDLPETIRKRLSIDRKQASPLLGYYRQRRLLTMVDGTGNVETVYKRAHGLFRRKGWIRRDRAQDSGRN
jgi:adenylate kinase